jgi:xanthine dehydrogenase accessory factor
METKPAAVLPRNTVLVRGGGDLASGVAWRLHRCGFQVIITEVAEPLAVRRAVSFCEAVFEERVIIEGVSATFARFPAELPEILGRSEIPVLVDPSCEVKNSIHPQVVVDAIMAKRNLGTSITDAPLVIGLGPGFTAGKDVHCVIETKRGHLLGRVLESGHAEPDTGTPGPVMGITRDRVIHSPRDGRWETPREIGSMVRAGDEIGTIDGTPVIAKINGLLRGIIRPGINLARGVKLGDIDPRGIYDNCFKISDKALAIAGGVLEAVLHRYSIQSKSKQNVHPVPSDSKIPAPPEIS